MVVGVCGSGNNPDRVLSSGKAPCGLWLGARESTGAQVFCQQSPCQVFSYEDTGPEQWRYEGVLVTPRSTSLGQGIKFSSNVNDAAIDSAALELPPDTCEGRDSRYRRTGEDDSLSKAVPET